MLHNWTIRWQNENSPQYNWTGPGLSCTDCIEPTFRFDRDTSYRLLVTDAYDCSDSTTVRVRRIGEIPMVSDLSCVLSGVDAQTIIWTPVGGINNYEISTDGGATWQLTDGSDRHRITGLSPGDALNVLIRGIINGLDCGALEADYSCVFEGCQMTATPNQVVPPLCTGDQNGSLSLRVDANNGSVTYRLLDDDILQDDSLFTGLLAGNYTVEVIDSFGCTDLISVEITDPDPLEITLLVSDVSCAGGSDGILDGQVSGSQGSYSVRWSDNLSASFLFRDSLGAGSYTVMVQDSLGCQDSTVATISEPEPLALQIDTEPVACAGEATGSASITVSGGTGVKTVTWPDNFQGDQRGELLADDYNLIITDANNCSLSALVSILEPLSAVQAQVNQTFVACYGESANAAQGMADGGTPPYSYEWFDGNNSAQRSDLSVGDYSFIAIDANACRDTVSLSIEGLAAIMPDLIIEEPSCYGYTDGRITVNSVRGGNGQGLIDNYTFNWSVDTAKQESVLSDIGSGAYTLVVSDDQACFHDTTLLVDQPSEIQVELIIQAPSCADSEDGSLNARVISGDHPIVYWEWTDGLNTYESQQVSDINGGVYNLFVEDRAGCSASFSARLEAPPGISVAWRQTGQPSCFDTNDGEAILELSGGLGPLIANWSDGGRGTSRADLRVGSYEVIVEDSLDCKTSIDLTIEGPDPIVGLLESFDPICYGDENGIIEINASGGVGNYRYRLLDYADWQSYSSFARLGQGMYVVEVQDENNCSWLDTTTLSEPALFELMVPGEQEISLGDTIGLKIDWINAQGEVDLFWNIGVDSSLVCIENAFLCDSVSISPDYSNIYRITGIDEQGCEAEGLIKVIVNKPRLVHVPTGFSPNQDGVNDRLLVHAKESTQVWVKRFRVYDRWGAMVHESGDFMANDENFGWDGRFRDQSAMAGVYVWTLEAVFSDGQEKVYQGNTTLIR